MPRLLDAIHGLRLCPIGDGREQSEGQDDKGGPKRTHDRSAAATFATVWRAMRLRLAAPILPHVTGEET